MKGAYIFYTSVVLGALATSGPAWAGCIQTERGPVCQEQNFLFYDDETNTWQVKKRDPHSNSRYIEAIGRLADPMRVQRLGSNTVSSYDDPEVKTKVEMPDGTIKYKFRNGSELRVLPGGDNYVAFGSSGSVTGKGSLGGSQTGTLSR